MIKEDSKITDIDKDRLMAEMLMRLSTIEYILISKNVISTDEYANALKDSMDKLKEILKNSNNSEKIV